MAGFHKILRNIQAERGMLASYKKHMHLHSFGLIGFWTCNCQKNRWFQISKSKKVQKEVSCIL